MKNKIAITSYNPTRAKWYFALFKFLELFGVFLFTFGFYGLGCLVYKHFPAVYNFLIINKDGIITTTYFDFWAVGFITFFAIVFALIVTSGTLYLVYKIIKAWIKGNWNLAKMAAEDKTAKAKRLKQQAIEDKKAELEKKRADRSKWGYCVGDEVKIIRIITSDGEDVTDDGDDTNGKEYLGQNGKILRIKSNGSTRISNCGDYDWYKKELKITKKQPLK